MSRGFISRGFAAMANPIQQGLKQKPRRTGGIITNAAMANPIQQGLKRQCQTREELEQHAAMANPIQQGLKPWKDAEAALAPVAPQWLIQYNKD